MSETAGDLREQILNIVSNVRNGWTLGQVTDTIMAAMPDPRLSIGGNAPPEPVIEEPIVEESDEERLLRIDPENLLTVKPAEFPALFDLHYPALKQRAVEILEMCEQWQKDHHNPASGFLPVKDDTENAALGDLIRQIDDFAKEVDETRKSVKADIFVAGQQIDGWFARGLSDPVLDIRGVPKKAGGKTYQPGPGTMQFAQTAYLMAKIERERKAREAVAQAAREEAERRAQEAREAAAQEAQRIAALQRRGLSSDEATAIAQQQTDEASAEADNALASAEEVRAYAAEPSSALVRQHSAAGTTIGLGGRWTFEVTDMASLCLAAAVPLLMKDDLAQRVSAASQIGFAGAKVVLQTLAQMFTPPHGGPVPVSFVTTDDTQIRAAMTAKTSPLREAPGLRIYQEMSARRRGG